MGANVTQPRKVRKRTAGGGGKPNQQSPFPIGPENPPRKDTLYTGGIENPAAESEGEHPGTGDRNPHVHPAQKVANPRKLHVPPTGSPVNEEAATWRPLKKAIPRVDTGQVGPIPTFAWTTQHQQHIEKLEVQCQDKRTSAGTPALQSFWPIF